MAFFGKTLKIRKDFLQRQQPAFDGFSGHKRGSSRPKVQEELPEKSAKTTFLFVADKSFILL
jgi:hypothetical protein